MRVSKQTIRQLQDIDLTVPITYSYLAFELFWSPEKRKRHMNSGLIDFISGKQYDLETLENDLVRVESSGRCIRVGIKDSAGNPSSWWEPAYPFSAPPPGVSWPKQNGWHFSVEAPTPEQTMGIFERNGERHVLTLRVTDPTASPKPVEVTWE